MRFDLLIGLGVLVAVQFFGAAMADTTKTGTSVKIDGARGSVFAAGAYVEIAGDIAPGLRPMTGVLAAGGSVDISASIDGALAAAGGDVIFSGHAQNVFLSGGNVTVSGRVTEDAALAGGNLTLKPEATIENAFAAAGASLDILGSIGGDADLAGAYVRFNGAIEGDAEISGESIVIGPGARITGNLTYYSDSEAEISPRATIGGEVIARKESEREFKWKDAKRLPAMQGDLRSRAYGALFWFVALAASGALMLVIFPRWMGEAAAAGRDRPLTSILIGFAVLIALPVAAILLMIVVLGLPLGGFLLALYIGLLSVSMIGGGLAAGHLLIDKSGGRQAQFLAYFAGLAIVLIVGAAPYIGGVAGFFVMLLGLGVMFRGLYSALRGEAV